MCPLLNMHLTKDAVRLNVLKLAGLLKNWRVILKKIFLLISGCIFAQIGTAQVVYQEDVYLEPMPVWNYAGKFWDDLSVVLDLVNQNLIAYQGAYISSDPFIDKVWGAPGGGWAYNKKLFPFMYEVTYNPPNGPSWQGYNTIATSPMCPNGSMAFYYQMVSHGIEWRACKISVPTQINPGPAKTPQNPFVTGVDWTETGSCIDRPVTIEGRVVTRCFNRLSVY